MAMYAAAARSRLADIIGGDAGRELKASALARMSAERVQRPDNMLSMLAPGFLKRS
jgi:hypothetical protein